jgi:uncharacterized SAM-binding protein YcdF (DUF218 family)
VATAEGRKSLLVRAGAGVVLAAGGWLVLGILGVPSLAGLSATGSLPWVALAGAALGAVGLGLVLFALLAIGVLAVFAVSSFPFLDNRMATKVRSDSTAGARVDAVIVLSGNLSSQGRIGSEAVDRLLAGTRLRQQLGAGALVLTTSLRIRGRDTVSSNRDQRALVSRLDPGAELHFVGPVWSTYDEAVASAALAKQRGWTRVAVVTSPLHTRRACASFERLGLTVVCRASDSREYSLNLRRPAGDRLEAFRDWMYEVVATRVYRARGWLPERANRKSKGSG